MHDSKTALYHLLKTEALIQGNTGEITLINFKLEKQDVTCGSIYIFKAIVCVTGSWLGQ